MQPHRTKPAPSEIQKICETCKRPFWSWPSLHRRFCSNLCKYNCKHLVYESGHSAKTAPIRFEKQILRTETCWLWLGCKKRKGGYGSFSVRPGHIVMPHRYAYELWVGPIPDGLKLLHSCDNPACVNPAHLRPGTQAENIADAVAKDRHGRGERHARAKLTDEKVREIRHLFKQARTQVSLAAQFGVSRRAIRCVIDGSHWKHVT